MLIKALVTHSYGGKRRTAGTEFEAPSADAKILTQLRRAAYVTLAEPSHEIAEVEPELKEKPKRAYKRRDMKAED
jgi:hypothetical protein